MAEHRLSTDDVALHLDVTIDTERAWIADEGMLSCKIGRLRKFQAGGVRDWVRRSGTAALSGENQ